MTQVNPYLAGATGRCPRCGEGALFVGFLKVAPTCEACGLDLGRHETGDGAATFITLIVGTIACGGALFSMFAWHWPIWLLLVVWLPVAVGLCLGLMRPAKGLIVAAQIANNASEAGRDDV